MSNEINKNLSDKTDKVPIFHDKIPNDYGIMSSIKIGLNISTLPLLFFILLLFFIMIGF